MECTDTSIGTKGSDPVSTMHEKLSKERTNDRAHLSQVNIPDVRPTLQLIKAIERDTHDIEGRFLARHKNI